jgi:hypothetical protein
MARWAHNIHIFSRKDADIVLAFALAARKKSNAVVTYASIARHK